MHTKYIGLLLILLLPFRSQLKAQVFPDRHTTNAFDGWVSCTKSTNPNPARGQSHWIKYQFSTNVNLYDMVIWNLNNPDYIKDGVKDVIVDISLNGTTWTTIDTFTFPKGTGSGFYEGFHGPDLGGVQVRHLLITALSNHGGGCYGFSEMRAYTSNQQENNLEFNFTLCENDGIQYNLTGGVGTGIYSGIGVVNNGNGTFDFNANHVGPGVHPIKYTQGATVLNGQITVLPCVDPICRECKNCNVADILTVNGSIPTNMYNGFSVLSGGQVINNGDVRFMINNSAELNSGFQVNSTSNFLIDFRTCYNNILQNSGFEGGATPWSLSQHNGATATFTIDNVNPFEGNSSARIQVNSTNGTDWHIQLNQNNQSMVTGKRYRISFAARASTGGGPMSIIMQRNSSPWDVHGDADFTVSENWETYAFEFVADATITNNIGIRALLGATANKTFWIDNFQYIPLD